MEHIVSSAQDAVELMPKFDYDKEFIDIMKEVYRNAKMDRCYAEADLMTSKPTRVKLLKLGFTIFESWKYQRDSLYISIGWEHLRDKLKKKKELELVKKVKATDYPSFEEYLKTII